MLGVVPFDGSMVVKVLKSEMGRFRPDILGYTACWTSAEGRVKPFCAAARFSWPMNLGRIRLGDSCFTGLTKEWRRLGACSPTPPHNFSNHHNFCVIYIALRNVALFRPRK